jgi:A118 family predicted phage portal protein
MLSRLIQKIKGVLYKMNLIKGVKKIADHKEVYMNEDFYNHIDAWNDLYKGYYKDIHDITYFTIDKGQQSRRMHTLNMPKVVSEEMASLVFNEKCEISIDDESLREQINDVFKKNKFYKKFQDYLEYSFALGGMIIKPYVDNGEIKLSFVTADCFIPLSWNNAGVYEGVFVDEFTKGTTYYTHLEWHLWEGDAIIIRHTLHESKTKGELGIDITGRFNDFYPGIAVEATFPKAVVPSFVQIKPNLANNIDKQSPLGVSIYSSSIDTIKAIDTAFDSFEREFRLGKKKIIVPAQMIKTVVDPNTQDIVRYFDANDETYEAMKYSMDDGKPIDVSIELRVEEHISAINALLNLFAMQTGFSAGTFSFDGQSMKTATEVVSEQSKTFKSKKSHETVIEAGIQELIQSIVQMARMYEIKGFPIPEEFEVTVAFDDSIAEDKTAEVNRAIQLVSNKLLSRKKAIMRIHGLTEDEAEEWMQEINEEQATVTEESVNFFGTGGN